MCTLRLLVYAVAVNFLAVALFACATQQSVVEDDEAASSGVVELSEGVRVNRVERWVEFDAEVCAIEDPDVTVPLYLEQAVCSWDTREHESLFATGVVPSVIHTGLLLVGAEPGRPARWEADGADGLRAVPATGDRLDVVVLWETGSGEEEERPLSVFLRSAVDGASGDEVHPWLFAGSRSDGRRHPVTGSAYAADATGTVVGLSSFGTEVVSHAEQHHPDSLVDEPRWIARFESLPAIGTAVRIRLLKARD